MNLGTMEQRTKGLKRQAQELIEQAYHRGYQAGYAKAENDYYAKTEDDRQSSYELGLNMAWETAKKLSDSRNANEILDDDAIFYCVNIFERHTASEAIEKLHAYEEQKKQEDNEIKVGDEVRVGEEGSNAFSAVVHLVGDSIYQCVSSSGLHYTFTRNDAIRKTGRTFPEIAEVLKRMQECE